MPDIIKKMMLGHIVKSEKTITRCPNVEFGALYEAFAEIQDALYLTGRLDADNPIGFSRNPPFTEMGLLPKWRNLSKEDKAKLDGVLLSANFRNDAVKIIFFED